MRIRWRDCLKVGISVFVLYLATHYWQKAADLAADLKAKKKKGIL